MKKRISLGIVLATILLLALAISPAYGKTNGQAQSGNTPVIITFSEQPGPSEEAMVRRAGGTIKNTFTLVPAIAASLPAGAIQGLQNNPNITRIEPDIEVHAVQEALPWGVDRIDSEAVHAAGNNGSGVKLAVLDSGADLNHADLRIAGSVNFAKGKNADDKCGHGTHVSGTAAALDNDSGVIGVAPGVDLYAVKVLGNNCSGSYSDIIAGLQWAVNNGTQVTNNSYGSTGDPGQTVKNAFDNAYAAGIIHIAAAGNESGGQVIYPARWPSVVAVSATSAADVLASFSSQGSEVEIAAPGQNILSTTNDGGTGTKNGTSMASPHVAGVAALIIAAGISDTNGVNGIADEVRARLNATAEDLGLPANQQGSGLVDAAQAVGATPPTPNDAPVVSIASPADSATFTSGDLVSFAGTTTDTEDGVLTASLAWNSDIDGAIGSGGGFDATLSDGDHTITASVSDSGGKTGSDSINITVGNPPAEATVVSVSSIDYATEGGRNGDKHLLIFVSLTDDLGNSVSGASVSVALTRNGLSAGSATGTSGADGKAAFTLKNARSGRYETNVTNVSAAGLTWDQVVPANFFDK